MKQAWTRGEKWLWAAPILFGVAALGISFGPNAARRALGWPQQLSTTSTNALNAVVLSRDGSVLAATGRDDGRTISPESGTVYLWDAKSRLPLKPFAPQRWKGKSGYWDGWIVDGVSLSPNGKLIGIRGRGGPGFAVYEVESQKLLWHTSTNTQYAEFSANGRFVALGQFELRESQSGKLVTRWKAPNASMNQHFSLSPDGNMVAWINATKPRPALTGQNTARLPDGQAIEIRHVRDGKIVHLLPNSQETESVAFSPDGSRLVSVAQGDLNTNAMDGSMVRCHSKGGKLLWERDFRQSNPKNSGDAIYCDAVFSTDGKTIALRGNGSENRLIILDASTGGDKQHLKTVRGEYTSYLPPLALAFSPDRKRLFARGKSAVLVYDLK